MQLIRRFFSRVLNRILDAYWCDAAYTELKNADWDTIDLREFKQRGGKGSD